MIKQTKNKVIFYDCFGKLVEIKGEEIKFSIVGMENESDGSFNIKLSFIDMEEIKIQQKVKK